MSDIRAMDCVDTVQVNCLQSERVLAVEQPSSEHSSPRATIAPTHATKYSSGQKHHHVSDCLAPRKNKKRLFVNDSALGADMPVMEDLPKPKRTARTLYM